MAAVTSSTQAPAPAPELGGRGSAGAPARTGASRRAAAVGRRIFSAENLLRVALLAVLLGAWQLVSVLAGTTWVSSPWLVEQRYQQLLGDGTLVQNSYITLREAVLGLVIGTFIGLAAGILIARSHRLELPPG